VPLRFYLTRKSPPLEQTVFIYILDFIGNKVFGVKMPVFKGVSLFKFFIPIKSIDLGSIDLGITTPAPTTENAVDRAYMSDKVPA
jgi:hypothetical protein